jgi:hypothetical protein
MPLSTSVLMGKSIRWLRGFKGVLEGSTGFIYMQRSDHYLTPEHIVCTKCRIIKPSTFV